MFRKPRSFTGYDLRNGLTEAGLEAVLSLADLDILDVVVDRFADTPPEVRRQIEGAYSAAQRFIAGLRE